VCIAFFLGVTILISNLTATLKDHFLKPTSTLNLLNAYHLALINIFLICTYLINENFRIKHLNQSLISKLTDTIKINEPLLVFLTKNYSFSPSLNKLLFRLLKFKPLNFGSGFYLGKLSIIFCFTFIISILSQVIKCLIATIAKTNGIT
jgi:hypothetical protein